MTSPIELAEAVVDDLKELFPAQARNIEVHNGRIDVAAIKKWVRSTPAIRVAVLGARNIESVGNGQVDVGWAINVYVVDDDALKASNFSTAIIVDAEGNQRSLDDVHPPEQLRCDNLHASPLEKLGVTIWAVSWAQAIRTGLDELAEQGVVPSNVYASRAPNIGEDHKEDYRDVQTGEAPDDG